MVAGAEQRVVLTASVRKGTQVGLTAPPGLEEEIITVQLRDAAGVPIWSTRRMASRLRRASFRVTPGEYSWHYSVEGGPTQVLPASIPRSTSLEWFVLGQE